MNWAITAALILAHVVLPSEAFQAASRADGGLDASIDLMMVWVYLAAATLGLVAYSALLARRSRTSPLDRNILIVLLLWLHTFGNASRGASAHSAVVQSVTDQAEAIRGAIQTHNRANHRCPERLTEVFGVEPTYTIPLGGSKKPFNYRVTATGFVLGFYSGWYTHETTESGGWAISD